MRRVDNFARRAFLIGLLLSSGCSMCMSPYDDTCPLREDCARCGTTEMAPGAVLVDGGEYLAAGEQEAASGEYRLLGQPRVAQKRGFNFSGVFRAPHRPSSEFEPPVSTAYARSSGRQPTRLR
jgi:hypothetical protein